MNRKKLKKHEKLDARTDYIYNHFIPKFYQKHFTFDDKQEIIYVTDLKRNNTYEKNISDIGGEYYLNTEEYEKLLGRDYENRYAETLRKIQIMDRAIKLNLQLPRGYGDDFFDFIAFIHSHNLYMRKRLADTISKAVSQNSELYRIDYHKQDILAKESFEFWKKEFSSWKLIFHYSDQVPLNYITCDKPVLLFSTCDDFSTMNSVNLQFLSSVSQSGTVESLTLGINDNNACFMIPASNNTIIWGFKDHALARNFSIKMRTGHTKSQRMHINALLLCGSEAYVFSKSKEDIRELNRCLRGVYNQLGKWIHPTYDPYLEP